MKYQTKSKLMSIHRLKEPLNTTKTSVKDCKTLILSVSIGEVTLLLYFLLLYITF